MKDLTIIMPVYNEAKVIEGVLTSVYHKVLTKIPNSDLVIAEDGSTDTTKDILKRLQRQIPFTLIQGTKRKGYAKAFKDSLKLADKELVFFSDSDGQHDPDDILNILDKASDYDIVGGYKAQRQDPVHRVFISKTFNFIVSVLFGLEVRDINSGFKLIRRKVIDEILDDVTIMRQCVMSEFVIRSHMAGYRFKEIPVKHFSRRGGQSKVFTLLELPLVIINIMGDLLKLKISFFKTRDMTNHGWSK